jgi:hypothetical protein
VNCVRNCVGKLKSTSTWLTQTKRRFGPKPEQRSNPMQIFYGPAIGYLPGANKNCAKINCSPHSAATSALTRRSLPRTG